VTLVDVQSAAHRGGSVAAVGVIATKVSINEYKYAEPAIEVLGAHIEH
jgi:hypothetical protein